MIVIVSRLRKSHPHQVSIFIHSHGKWPHPHEKPLIVVFNDSLVVLPDGLPLFVVLRDNTKHTKTEN